MAQPNLGTVEVRIPVFKQQTSVIDNEFGSHHEDFAREMRRMEEEMGKLTGQINEGNQRLASRIVKTSTTTTTRTSSGGSPMGSTPIQAQVGVPQQIQLQYTPSPPPQMQIQSQPQQHFSTQSQSNVQNFAGGQTISSSTHSTRTTTHTSSTGSSAPQPQQLYITNGSNVFNQQQQQQQQQYYSDVANNQEVQQWLGGLNSPLIAGRQEISGQDGKCLRLRFDVSQYSPEEISVKTVDGKLVVHAKHEEKTESRSSYREFNKEFSLPIGTNPESIKSTLSRDGILTVEAPLPGSDHQLGAPQQHLPISSF